MSGDDAKRKLIEYLDEHAFQPVLRAKPEDYPEGKRDKLADVQRATESEVKRFQGYESAEKVVDMYRVDLSSSRAKEIHSELRDLGLPTINEVRDFLKARGRAWRQQRAVRLTDNRFAEMTWRARFEGRR